uniref:Ig-like domain-containing protein n=1 Tax=Anabas testudineus TaxID=64144 RepID=A0A7N6AID3_ANATE
EKKLLSDSSTLNLNPVFFFSAVKSNVTGSHEPVRAVVGEDVILPCHLEPPFDVTTLRVDWKFNGQFVHVYRSLKDDPDPQHEQFKHRTSLFHDEMHKGNISLKLTNVSEADKGHYTCYVPKLESQRGNVTLIVVFYIQNMFPLTMNYNLNMFSTDQVEKKEIEQPDPSKYYKENHIKNCVTASSVGSLSLFQ